MDEQHKLKQLERLKKMEHPFGCTCYSCWIRRQLQSDLDKDRITIIDGKERMGMSTMGMSISQTKDKEKLK